MRKASVVAQALALPLILLAIWEGAGQLEMLPAGILPSPSMIVRTWREWAFGSGGFGLNPYSGTWFDTVWFSARRVAQGFFWACVVGIPVGIVIGWSALAARSVDPLIQGLRRRLRMSARWDDRREDVDAGRRGQEGSDGGAAHGSIKRREFGTGPPKPSDILFQHDACHCPPYRGALHHTRSAPAKSRK